MPKKTESVDEILEAVAPDAETLVPIAELHQKLDIPPSVVHEMIKESKQSTPRPSLGCMVHYADTWHPGTIRAAWVDKVHSDTEVDLFVLDPTQNPHTVLVKNVPLRGTAGDRTIGVWLWPERV